MSQQLHPEPVVDNASDQPTRLQIQHPCSNSAQANRDRDLSSGRMYSVWNNLAVPLNLELKFRYQQLYFFGKRSTSERELPHPS